MKFPIQGFFSKWEQIRSFLGLVTFSEEILNGNLHFLCSVIINSKTVLELCCVITIVITLAYNSFARVHVFTKIVNKQTLNFAEHIEMRACIPYNWKTVYQYIYIHTCSIFAAYICIYAANHSSHQYIIWYIVVGISNITNIRHFIVSPAENILIFAWILLTILYFILLQSVNYYFFHIHFILMNIIKWCNFDLN